MRIGYVGLSSPIAYDYGTEASRAPSDLFSSPNPVLDSPIGLMLFYDELWFICRSLCPENMRGLDFVRFLDEDGTLPDLTDLDLLRLPRERPDEYNRLTLRLGSFEQFNLLMGVMQMHWEARPDNHTHGLRVGGLETTGNSARAETILFDLAVIERLENADLELVGNSFGQALSEGVHPNLRAADLAHVLVIDNLPNYLQRTGPYHPVLAEAREDRFLKEFRRWVSETAPSTTVDEAAAVKTEVEAGVARLKDELFLEHFDPRAQYFSAGKTLTGGVASLLVPGVGEFSELIQNVRQERRAKDGRWQGFLVSFGRSAAESEAAASNS